MILDAMTELELRDGMAIHEMGLRHAISDNLLHADADDLRSIAAVLGISDCLSAQALDEIEEELAEQEGVLVCI